MFLDSAVAGLRYRSGPFSGTTGGNGGFEYEPGRPVELAVGGLVLGTTTGRPQVTVVDLVVGATDEMHPRVTNIARFLQTIDNDADPRNGIRVLKRVAALGTAGAIDFSLPVADFEADAAVVDLVMRMTALTRGGERPLVSTVIARSHLRGTLMSILAGRYEGGYSGNETGNWQIFVGTDHSATGWTVVTETGEIFGLAGSVTSNGVIGFGNPTLGVSFSGSIVNHVAQGTWVNEARSTAGRFAGDQALTAAPSVDPARVDAVAGRYVGRFELGADEGPLVMELLANGDVRMGLGNLRASAAIAGLVGDEVRIRGLAEDGSAFDGTCSPAGELSGELRNGATGATGTFEGQRELGD